MTLNPNKAPSTLTHEEKVGIQVIRVLTDSPELHQAEIDSVYEYAHDLNAMGNRIERIENAAQAMGIDDHSWADPEEGMDGGAALVKLAERMHAADAYELSDDEKNFLKYEDTAMAAYEARASIDPVKLLEKNPADSFDQALEAVVTRERNFRKQRLEDAENGTLPEGFRADVKYYEASFKRQNHALRYVQNRHQFERGNKLLDLIDAKAADPENSAILTDLEEVAKEAERTKKVNKSTAKTFIELARLYPNEEYQAPIYTEETEEESVPAEAQSGAVSGNAPARSQGKRARKDSRRQGPGRQTRQPVTPGSSRRSSRQENQTASTNESGEEEERELASVGAGARNEARGRRERAQNASGNQPPAGPPNNPNSGNAGNNSGDNNNPNQENQSEVRRMRLEGQRLRVQNAAERLASEGRKRSRFENFGGEGDEHEDFRHEVLKLMYLEHPEFLQLETVDDADKEDLKALSAHMNAYVTEKYNLVTKATVDGMGGEKDPKKRKRNNRIIRIGASTVGMFLGGPAGAVVAGSIALGVTKAIDYEFKGREKLANSIEAYNVQRATDEYIDNLDGVGDFNSLKAFEAATHNLREQYERGVVIGRNKRIGGAFLVGGAWGLGTYLGLHQAADVLSYGGGEFRHWFSTLDNPAGHPGYNYVPGDKPFSLSFLQAVFNNPLLTTVGVGTAAAAGAAVAKSRRVRR